MTASVHEIQQLSATPDQKSFRLKNQSEESSASRIHNIAATGTQGLSRKLPHYNKIQASFGQHSISHVQAYMGKQASTASQAIHAQAYTTGHKVIFAQSNPSLHLVAHEAAHVIQQQSGVQLKEGVGRVGDQYEQQADAVADQVVQGKSAVSLLDRFSQPQGLGNQVTPSITSVATQRCVQMASTYTGDDLDTAAFKPADWNAIAGAPAPAFADVINNNGTTAQNTGKEGHAKEIKWGAAGGAVAAQPTNWLKFTRLVGPYAAGNSLVQGHLINQRMGGQGNAANLTPITASANAVHYSKVEKPIIDWLMADTTNNYVDYKVTPNYGAAAATLKTKLSNNQFAASQGIARGDTRKNLKDWVEDYIDEVIPAKLDIEVTFAKRQQGKVSNAVYKRNKVNGEVTNEENAQYNGGNVLPSGPYNNRINYKFFNRICNGRTRANNTGTYGYAEAIDDTLVGAGVNSVPTDWNKFLTLVGPWATQNFKQGHLINERMGGIGNANNLTPITASANSTHWSSVEIYVKDYISNGFVKGGYDPVVYYKVTPDYSGADAGLKTKLLNEFDATQNDALGTAAAPQTQVNQKAWLDTYIDDTFADKLGIEVKYLKKTGRTYEETKLLKGDVSNEPA